VPQELELGVGAGGLEVAAQGFGGTRGGQWDVSTSFRVTDSDPRGVEEQDRAQRQDSI
jgi:hypothetical protein